MTTEHYAPGTTTPRRAKPAGKRRSARVAGIAAAAVALAGIGLAAGLLIRGEAPPPPAQPLPAAETSPKQLRSFAAAQGHAVYWAGTLPGRKLELTENRRGDVFVRYLPAGTPLGDRRPEFTTVATYPLKVGAYDVATGATKKKGMVSKKARGGGIAVWSRQRPTSVYLAYPTSNLLVEVYDPSDKRAQRLALSGEVKPVR